MAVARKRNRPDDWEDIEPSMVIHVRGLPDHTLELDLIHVFEQFGTIQDVIMIPQKGQALIEFHELSSSERAVSNTSKRVVDRPVPDGENPENRIERRVLLLTVYNPQYPITVDVVYQISSKHGRVLRIVIVHSTRVQAMVEFKTEEEASIAKRHLNGADIYSGCCTLKVEFARTPRLTVNRNDETMWDFENPYLNSNSLTDSADSRNNASLLGRFERSRARHESSHSMNDNYYGYPESYIEPNLVPIQAPVFSDYIGMGFQEPKRGYAGPINNEEYVGNLSSVIMIYNLDMERINCDRLFNLICLYGNVVRIKFLRTKEGSAMAQMGDIPSANRVISNLSDACLMGRNLSVRPSKQQLILDVQNPFELADGTSSFKDYSGCRENRYINADKASKNRIYPPTLTLHYWNCPPTFTTDDLRRVIAACDSVLPRKIAPFTKFTDRSSSGLIEWFSIEDAVNALALCNHQPIPSTEGRYPYLLKLSFSASTISVKKTNEDSENSKVYVE